MLSEWILNAPRLTTREEIAGKVVQLEADNARLHSYAEFVIEKDYGAEFDEWIKAIQGAE